VRRRATLLAMVALSGSLAACRLANPLVGEWRVYRMQDADGSVIEMPETYDLRIVYSDRCWVQYEPGKDPQTVEYSLHRDRTGLYAKVK